VSSLEVWVRSLGFVAERTQSMGMENLVAKERGWPRHGMQFCTEHLKLKPSLAWLNRADPDALATCLVGVRREESARRRNFPEWTENSDVHGGRSLWAPLVNTTEAERNALLCRAGADPLPHRSDECSPCVNATKADIRRLPAETLAKVERIERGLGHTAKGKPRVMFRPAAHMGAVGIREIYRWAHSDRGKYELGCGGCDSGMCAA
jgi:3'-phosphoadenosine 5'-phosphosulfate sulfotransferase (PAPS reductase)/FAD synthetase